MTIVNYYHAKFKNILLQDSANDQSHKFSKNSASYFKMTLQPQQNQLKITTAKLEKHQ